MVPPTRDDVVLIVRMWHDSEGGGLRIRIVEVAPSGPARDPLAALAVDAALTEIGRRLHAFDAPAPSPRRGLS